MTINDIELEKHIREIHKNAGVLDQFTRDGMEGSLFLALMLLREYADKAQARLNEIKYPPKKVA